QRNLVEVGGQRVNVTGERAFELPQHALLVAPERHVIDDAELHDACLATTSECRWMSERSGSTDSTVKPLRASTVRSCSSSAYRPPLISRARSALLTGPIANGRIASPR